MFSQSKTIHLWSGINRKKEKPMKRTIKLLSTVLLALTLLLVSQTTSVSAAENYKQYDCSTYYATTVSQKTVQKAMGYVSKVPQDILTVYKTTNTIYFVKTWGNIEINYAHDYSIIGSKNNLVGVVKQSANISNVYILASASVKDVKKALLSAVGYYVDTQYYNHPSSEPIFRAFYMDYMKTNSKTPVLCADLFIMYFCDYCNKVAMDKGIYNYYTALLNPAYAINTSINSDASQRYNTNHVSADRQNSITYAQLNDFAVYDDTLDLKTVNEVKSWLAFVPNKVIDRFYQDGWTLVLTDELTYIDGKSGYTGLCNYDNRLIGVKSNLYGLSQITMLHEFGHFVDYTYSNYSFLSNNADFQILYNKYKATYVEIAPRAQKGYATSNAKEFFATTFEEYYLYSDKLKEQVPDVYAYIGNLNKTVLH